LQRPGQPAGAMSVSWKQIWHLLYKSKSCAISVHTAKSFDDQNDVDLSIADRKVGRRAIVVTVNPTRFCLAGWTDSKRTCRLCFEDEFLILLLKILNGETR
jgi:hypothetical protein